MTPPTVTILSPMEGQQVEIGGEPPPTVQYTCDDDVSGDLRGDTRQQPVRRHCWQRNPPLDISYGPTNPDVPAVKVATRRGTTADSSQFEVGPAR